MRYPRDSGHRDLLTWLARDFKPHSYLEVGVREGDSVIAVLKGHHPNRLILCDDWGVESGGTGRGNHEHIKELLDDHNYSGDVCWLDGQSQKLLPHFHDTADIVHIDGDHREEEALKDLIHGWIKANRVMVVHDIKFSTVMSAIDRFEKMTGICMSETYTGDQGTGVYYV